MEVHQTILACVRNLVSDYPSPLAIQTGVGSHDSSNLQFIKPEFEFLEPTPNNIIMVTLWVLLVKCKLRESLKK